MPDLKDDKTGAPTEPTTGSSVSDPNDLWYKDKVLDDFHLEEVLVELGYGLEVARLDLPTQEIAPEQISPLQQYVEIVPSHVDLSESAAVREFITVPLLFAATRAANAWIGRSVTLQDDPWRTILDYRIRSKHAQLIVETRYTDLEKGFAHLAVQMALLHMSSAAQGQLIYGAISTSGAWRFAALLPEHEGAEKKIVKDLNLFGVPPDVVEVVERLAGGLLKDGPVIDLIPIPQVSPGAERDEPEISLPVAGPDD